MYRALMNCVCIYGLAKSQIHPSHQQPTADISLCVLPTGATSFLGKVALKELLRRKAELDLSEVLVLMRPKNGQTASRRFYETVVPSQCFSRLGGGWWTSSVRVIEGDIAVFCCGIGRSEYAKVTWDVTHVIHCASSSSSGETPSPPGPTQRRRRRRRGRERKGQRRRR